MPSLTPPANVPLPSRSRDSGGNFPADILCFWHNIDFGGKAAGGLLMTFHITLEKGVELFTCPSNREGGGGMCWKCLEDF